MSPNDVSRSIRLEPFVPFRMFLTDGSFHDVRHPEMIFLGVRTSMLYATDNTGSFSTAPITARTEVQAYACAYALHLAEVGTGSLIHSNEAARDAALGCASGDIIAYSSGTSIQLILDAWFASAPHMANIKNSMWRTVGIAFVTRTQPNGDIVTFGVTDFAIC